MLLQGALRLCDRERARQALAPGLEGGGAPSYGETGLWDSTARTAQLDGDGVAAEVIFAQGSVAFHTYPAVGGGQKVDFKATPEQIALLLSHEDAARQFSQLRTVVLDELHALTPSASTANSSAPSSVAAC